MRLLFGLLFVMLQLRPFAGVVMCVHNAAHDQEGCNMPMTGEVSEGTPHHSESPSDCSQMAICAPALTVIAPVSVQLTVVQLIAGPQYSNPANLILGDSAAPPQPPPIA